MIATGYIYKITNKINGKIYIGQTQQHYTTRFIQHLSHARTGESNHKLARAIRKYGEENFFIEVIEEIPISDLDEREIYWIAHYDSTNDKNGYNILAGGQLTKKRVLPDNYQEILDYYYQCHNQHQTEEHFNISDYKLRQILLLTNSPTDKTNYGKHVRTRVRLVELDQEFDSQRDCARFFIENELCQTKKLECAVTRINKALKEGWKIYGFTIEKIE